MALVHQARHGTHQACERIAMSTAGRTRFPDLRAVKVPITQALVAAATTPEIVIAVSETGELGSRRRRRTDG
jgi:hypothetical protein